MDRSLYPALPTRWTETLRQAAPAVPALPAHRDTWRRAPARLTEDPRPAWSMLDAPAADPLPAT